jgi:transcriptional regulator with XRE-family HTH domain
VTEIEGKRRGRKPAFASGKAFPKVFRDAVQTSGVNQVEISATLGVSTAYVSQLSTGLKTPRPETIDRLAAAIGTDEKTARRLHAAAARDMGFRLDLPEDF